MTNQVMICLLIFSFVGVAYLTAIYAMLARFDRKMHHLVESVDALAPEDPPEYKHPRIPHGNNGTLVRHRPN